MSYDAASHQGAVQMFWLCFWRFWLTSPYLHMCSVVLNRGRKMKDVDLKLGTRKFCFSPFFGRLTGEAEILSLLLIFKMLIRHGSV